MYYNEITEEMWDKIEAEGIVVLQNSQNFVVNFVSNYHADYAEDFVHNGHELDTDLESIASLDLGWSVKWEIVKRPEKQFTIIDCKFSKDPVVEWLDKYAYVFVKDNHVGSLYTEADLSHYILTDYGDIRGTQSVVDFINNRYELLQKKAETNKQKELAEKKAKLLEELAAIDKELEGV